MVPGRYIVVYKGKTNLTISEQAAQEAVEKTEAIFSELNIKQDSLIHQYKYALKGFAARLTDQQVEKLRKDPRVEQVVQDVKYKAIQTVPIGKPSAPSALMSQSIPWGVSRVGGPMDGTGKTAWILDTGIDLDHPDLNVNYGNSVSFVAGESADDGNSHGTHVAGTIAAKNNSIGVAGVAADAHVVAVKVCDNLGRCYTSDVDAGVDYVASHYSSGDVANISLGWPTSDPEFPRIDLALSVLENTIETAADNGLMFTIAAGNENQHSNNKSPARIEHSNIWTLSAFDRHDNFAYFSNYGNPPVEYSAPGVGVISSDVGGGTSIKNGTSMAAPHMAGLLLTAFSDIITDGYVKNDSDNNADPIAYVPLEASISGSTYLDSGEEGSWTVNTANSTGNNNYQWYYRNTPNDQWTSAGSNSSTFNHTFYNNSGMLRTSEVRVIVTSGSKNTEDIHAVNVYSEGCEPPATIC